jgi:hypothetical protein
MNTNWNMPRRNILAALLDLRQALAAGMNARLVRARNEDCAFPIKIKHPNPDFRNYEFSSGLLRTRVDICNDTQMSDFQKYLTLNFKTCYGTQEAMQHYYKTGLLGSDNFKGQGKSHLVRVTDMIMFLLITGETERALMFRHQYLTEAGALEKHFYDFFRYKYDNEYVIKKFKHRLWVIEHLKDDQPKTKVPIMIYVLNTLLYPLKYIPQRHVLRMDDYKIITYRVGDVMNGFAVKFHVPKKFSFNN